MDFATDYSTCVDWAYESASVRADAADRRYHELLVELKDDRAAVAEAWDIHTCHELTGNEIAQFIRDQDKDGLFRAVDTLVRLGLAKVAEERAALEVGRG
jgi:hypothetical protein